MSKRKPEEPTVGQYLETLMHDTGCMRFAGRWAVNALTASEGREVSCSELDDVMLERLATSMRATGYREKTILDYASALRWIIRQWDPERFPRVPGFPGNKVTTSPHPLSPSDRGSPLLETVYQEQYRRIRLRSRRPNTLRLYEHALTVFSRFLGRPARVCDLTDDTLISFASWRTEQGRKPKTINRDLGNLLAIWRWLHGRRAIDHLPNVELEKVATRVPIALMRDEMQRLMQSAAVEPRPVGSIPGPVFWRAVLLVIWDTAERIGAVRQLTWEQVDLEGRWIRFVAEHRKGAGEDNMLPIAADTCDALRTLRSKCDGTEVFPWPYCYELWFHRFRTIMLRAGLPDNRLFKFHVIRKTVASYYEAAGGNATALLKHSDRKVTLAYLDCRIVKVPNPIDLLFRPEE